MWQNSTAIPTHSLVAVCSYLQGTFASLFILFARGWWPWLFTSSQQVKDLVTALLAIQVWLVRRSAAHS